MQNFSYKDVFYDLTCKGREFQDACKLAHTHTGTSLPFSPALPLT